QLRQLGDDRPRLLSDRIVSPSGSNCPPHKQVDAIGNKFHRRIAAANVDATRVMAAGGDVRILPSGGAFRLTDEYWVRNAVGLVRSTWRQVTINGIRLLGIGRMVSCVHLPSCGA